MTDDKKEYKVTYILNGAQQARLEALLKKYDSFEDDAQLFSAIMAAGSDRHIDERLAFMEEQAQAYD